MICVECGEPVNDTYRLFDGGGIRVTRCEACQEVADRYVEHEFVIIFLDLVLHKHQAYRHVLFNRLDYREAWISPRIVQLAFFIVLLEAYDMTQHRYMGGWNELAPVTHWEGYTPTQESWQEFGLLFLYSLVQFVLFIGSVVAGAKLYNRGKFAIVKYNYLVMALILSSFGRCFSVLLMIWDYDDPQSFAHIVNMFIFTSNVVAVQVWLGSFSWISVALPCLGWMVRLAFSASVQYVCPFRPTPGLLSPTRNSTTLINLPPPGR